MIDWLGWMGRNVDQNSSQKQLSGVEGQCLPWAALQEYTMRIFWREGTTTGNS